MIVYIMLSGDLATFLSDTLQIKPGTVLERAKLLRAPSAGLLSKRAHGPRGGARMTESDCINSLLANVLECPHGARVAIVQQARALPWEKRIALPRADFVAGLTCFFAETAGDALDALLTDIRTGRMDAWAAGEKPDISVTLDSRGESVLLSLGLPKRHERDFRLRTAIQVFGPDYNTKQVVTRQVSILGDWFYKIAAALGPPSESS